MAVYQAESIVNHSFGRIDSPWYTATSDLHRSY